jgi:hypothetical protein
MLIKMTLFRKKMQYFYKKIYNCLFCITKVSPITKNEYCHSCREYLLNQADDNSSISNLDYNNIYVDCAKLDSF